MHQRIGKTHTSGRQALQGWSVVSALVLVQDWDVLLVDTRRQAWHRTPERKVSTSLEGTPVQHRLSWAPGDKTNGPVHWKILVHLQMPWPTPQLAQLAVLSLWQLHWKC